MPVKTFALEPGGPSRLALHWKPFWRNTRVELDGQPLGVIPNQRALKDGIVFQLPNGEPLRIQMTRGMAPELQLSVAGRPLPGSAADPQQRIKTAAQILWFIAGLNLLLGVISLFVENELLATLAAGWPTIATGALYLVLGFLARRGARVAVIAGIALLVVDTILVLSAGDAPGSGGTVARVFLIIGLAQALPAMKPVRAE